MLDFDMSDVLLSSEWLQTVSLIRNHVDNDSGFSKLTRAAPVDIDAIVIQAPGTDLQRDADGTSLDTGIDIHTLAVLTAGSGDDPYGNEDADIVVYKGNEYLVVQVSDWSEYGEGFSSCKAILRKPRSV